MRRGRGKSVAIASLGFAIVAIGIASPKLLRLARERWYLSMLESTDARERETALVRLGDMRSVKAVPRVLEMLVGTSETGFGISEITIESASFERLSDSSLTQFLVESAGGEAVWKPPNSIWLTRPPLEVHFRGSPGALRGVSQLFDNLWWKSDGFEGKLRAFLGKLGPQALLPLQQAFRDASRLSSVRVVAALALLNLSPENPDTRDTFTQAKSDSSSAIRVAAEFCLSQLDDRETDEP
jgi:hypothetical protein